MWRLASASPPIGGPLSDVAIWFATDYDIGAVARIHTDSWRRHYRGMYADHYLDGDLFGDRLAVWTERIKSDDPNRFTLMAEHEGKPVGFAHVMLDADATWGTMVENLHVSYDAQGKGIGSLLLDRVARIVAEQRPGSGIYLWVLELNTQATAFYVARKGVLRDSEPSAAPGGNPANLQGHPRRVRVTWTDPAVLMRPERKSPTE